ncbi:MAG: hypothetical protein U9R00_01710 [Patescibacteria group bacterium]|nr:hypothetical protein [Patescibacteria group bacterium]
MKNIDNRERKALIEWITYFKNKKYFYFSFGEGINNLIKQEKIILKERGGFDRDLKPYDCYLWFSHNISNPLKDEILEEDMKFSFGCLFKEDGSAHIGSVKEPGVITTHVDHYGKTEKFRTFLRKAMKNSWVSEYEGYDWKKLREKVDSFSTYMDIYVEAKVKISDF